MASGEDGSAGSPATSAGDRPGGRRALGFALIAAALWGLSGTAAQALFQTYGFPPSGLVSVRMLGAGALLYLLLRPAFPRGGLLRFLPFAVVGLFGVQITFFLAIDRSNAATATLLQSLQLPLMAGYEVVVGRRTATRRWAAAIVLAVAGTALVVLGRASVALALTPLGLLFGLLAAGTAAYYTLASRAWIARSGAGSVTTWGFLLGGGGSLLLGAPALVAYAPTVRSVAAIPLGLVAFVVLFGTLLAFGLFLTSVGRIGASEAGVAATIEPIAAGAAALVFLGVLLTPFQYVGGALVLGAVYLLASRPGGGRPSPPGREK